ncbi:DMT family transporter [Micromonospora sp. 067-2]|uniref:DMT family transporter n=1 Tax=Micromonospora sp. 067-2 TaxID=2789270 RepID=UPI00397E0A53
MSQPWRLGALVLAALGWGSSAAFTKHALDGFPPITLLAVQLVVANLILWPVLAVRGMRRPSAPWRFALLGFFEPALAYTGLTLGLGYTTAANASLLSSLESCFVVILAALFLGERIGRRSAFGLFLAVIGVAVLNRADSVNAISLGDMLITGGALSAAIYVIFASRVAPHVDPVEMTTYQFGFGLLFTLPAAAVQWLSGHERLADPAPAGDHWIAAVAGGGLGFAMSFLLYNFAIRTVPAGAAGMTLNLIPVFGVIAAVVGLNEPFTLTQALGAALIVGGLVAFPHPGGDDTPAVPSPAPQALVAAAAASPPTTTTGRSLANER